MAQLLPKLTQIKLELTLHNEHPAYGAAFKALLTDQSVVIAVQAHETEDVEDYELWVYHVTPEQAQQIRLQVMNDGFSLSCEWYWARKGVAFDEKDVNEFSDEDEAEEAGYQLELRVEV